MLGAVGIILISTLVILPTSLRAVSPDSRTFVSTVVSKNSVEVLNRLQPSGAAEVGGDQPTHHTNKTTLHDENKFAFESIIIPSSACKTSKSSWTVRCLKLNW